MERCKTAEETQETLDIIAPFLPRAIVNELCSGRLHADYREAHRRRQLAFVNYGIEYQRRVIAPQLARSQPRERGGIRWLGTISEELEQSARTKYGRDCWSDPDFVRHTFKHTPEARAPRPQAPFVVVQGFRDNSRRLDGVMIRPGAIGNTGAANGRAAVAAGEGSRRGEPGPAVTNLSAHETKRAPTPFLVNANNQPLL